MINFKQYIKEECKKINPNIDYSSNNWEQKFIDKTNWPFISRNKDLSEDFMEYFKEHVHWFWISEYQDLSKSFIKKHQNKIYFNWLFNNENITNEFIFDHIHWFINVKYSWRLEDKEFANKFNKYKKLFG